MVCSKLVRLGLIVSLTFAWVTAVPDTGNKHTELPHLPPKKMVIAGIVALGTIGLIAWLLDYLLSEPTNEELLTDARKLRDCVTDRYQKLLALSRSEAPDEAYVPTILEMQARETFPFFSLFVELEAKIERLKAIQKTVHDRITNPEAHHDTAYQDLGPIEVALARLERELQVIRSVISRAERFCTEKKESALEKERKEKNKKLEEYQRESLNLERVRTYSPRAYSPRGYSPRF